MSKYITEQRIDKGQTGDEQGAKGGWTGDEGGTKRGRRRDEEGQTGDETITVLRRSAVMSTVHLSDSDKASL